MKLILSLLSLVVLATGCPSKNNESAAKLSPLTAEQKARFKATMTSVGTAQNSVIEAKQGNNHPTPLNLALTPEEQTQLMAKSLKASNCQIEIPGMNTGSGTPTFDPMNFSFAYKSSGASCPVNMEMVISAKMIPSGNGVTITNNVSATYGVSVETYKQLNDVFAFEMKSDSEIKAQQDSSGQGSMVGTGNTTGFIKSGKEGEVTISGSMTAAGRGDQNSGVKNQTEITRYAFKDMTVEMKAVTSGDGKTENTDYFINDEKVSEEEYQSLLSSGGPMMTHGKTKTEQK